MIKSSLGVFLPFEMSSHHSLPPSPASLINDGKLVQWPAVCCVFPCCAHVQKCLLSAEELKWFDPFCVSKCLLLLDTESVRQLRYLLAMEIMFLFKCNPTGFNIKAFKILLYEFWMTVCMVATKSSETIGITLPLILSIYWCRSNLMWFLRWGILFVPKRTSCKNITKWKKRGLHIYSFLRCNVYFCFFVSLLVKLKKRNPRKITFETK